MILKTVHIENYKCVKDSNEFRVDEKVTCLVGKNESGKTAVLQALSKLSPVDGSDVLPNFDELEYPRHKLSEYQESDDYADALTTTWQLDKNDISDLESLIGTAAANLGPITVRKGYENKVDYDLAIDESAVVAHTLASHELMDDERMALQDASDVSDLHKRLSQLTDPTQRQKDLLEYVEATFGGSTAHQKVVALLQERLPKIAYFSEYLRMPGQVSVNDIKARQSNSTLESGHHVFLALLAMIGRDIPELEKITEHERLIADLEGASNRLTQEIFRYWSQNRYLRVNFRFEQGMPGDLAPFNEGWVLRTRIENLRHGVTTSFDQRSAGFVWFFSFLVWFSQVRRKYGDRLVILLDEPGLTLHAKAQADLLRYIEERLALKYQVLYSTHSPFMIDPANLLRARTVEDVFLEAKEGESPPIEPEVGTKVGDDVLSTDRDTVFPLQACLGYEISQSLFVGEHTLLVEGPAEILYLEWFRRKLEALGRATLDKRWTICPCGGIDKVPAFLSLFAGNQLHIAVLTDFASGQKQRVKGLRDSKLLRDGHVLTADMYTGQAEADIEDLIGRKSYIDLVSQAYGLASSQNLPGTKPAKAPIRVVKEVEDHFRTMPNSVAEFDHYHPSEFLMQQGLDFTLPGIDAALDRFEKLFKDLNSLL